MWPNMLCIDHSLSLEAFWSHSKGIRQSLIWILVTLPVILSQLDGKQGGDACGKQQTFQNLGSPTRWKLSQRRSCWQWLLMSNDCNWMCVASCCGRFYLSCRYSKECDWFWAIITDLSGTLFWPYFGFGFFFPILVQNLVNLLNMPLSFS